MTNIYLRDSGFLIFIVVCFEIDNKKEGPLISLRTELNTIFFIKTKFTYIDEGGCQG